jgi:hypothetical protein
MSAMGVASCLALLFKAWQKPPVRSCKLNQALNGDTWVV